MNLILASLLVGFITLLLIYSLIVSLSTLEDLRLRDWLTLWPYQHWLGEFKAMFDLRIFMVGTTMFSAIVWISLKSSDTAKSSGQCKCGCKSCQESLRLARAAINYLALEDEEITELVAKPASK